MKIIFLEEFGKAFVPKRMRPTIRSFFLKVGITEVPYKLFGAFFYLSLIITFIIYFFKVYPMFFKPETSAVTIFSYTAITWFVLPTLLTALFGLALYFYIDIKIFNRTKKMEDVLPDFLRFVGENLRGGMPFERSLWTAIKPEFGILASEVRLAAKRVMTGEPVEDALHEFTGKYDSPMVRRSFDLIIEGMRGGGEIADLIDRVTEDLEETGRLKEEMRTANTTYVIFVTFVVMVVAPALFSLSYQFLLVLKGFGERLAPMAVTQPAAGVGGLGGFFPKLSEISIEPEQFKFFSQQAIAIVALFSSMIVSIINKGSIRGGVKYMPIFIVGSEVIYLAAMFVASKIFGGMFAF